MCSTQEWTLRHWQRTSAVQCCHHQPGIDKMIPFFYMSEDGSPQMSQIFISDKAQQSSNKSQLNYITRKKINCISQLPYIAILVDLGLSSPAFEANWFSIDGVESLRIYAAGINSTTFPFLDRHSHIADTLRYITSPPKSPALQDLQAKMVFGSSCRKLHMDITSINSGTPGDTATTPTPKVSPKKRKLEDWGMQDLVPTKGTEG